jgi:hypothetical protein
MNDGIEFMATMIGLLALLCIYVIVFGLRGTRKLLAWTAGLAVLGYAAMIVWAWETQGPDHWWNAPRRLLSDAEVGIVSSAPQAPQPPAPPAVSKPTPPQQTPSWSKQQADDFYSRNGQGQWGLTPNR